MSRVWIAIKRFGRILKFLLVCLVVAVCVFMVWRIFAGGTPKEIKALLPTDDLKLAYSQKGDELYIFEQKYDDITRAEYNEGYFAVPPCGTNAPSPCPRASGRTVCCCTSARWIRAAVCW